MSRERLPHFTLVLDAGESAELAGRYPCRRRTVAANIDRARFIATEAANEAIMRALRDPGGEAVLTIRVTRTAKKPPAWARNRKEEPL